MFTDAVGGTSKTRVKFRLAGAAQPLILLSVHVNGEGPFQFILDTGAGTSLVTPELARRLELPVIGAKQGHTAGGKVDLSLGRVRSISLGETLLKDLHVGIFELGHIARTIASSIDGDLGYDFFHHFGLTIDYKNLELQLHDPKRFDDLGERSLTEVPMRLAGASKPLILVDVFLSGRGPFQFAVDTGTSTTVISPELAAKLGVRSSPIGSATTGGAPVELTAGVVPEMQVGGARKQRLAVVIGPFLAMLSEVAGAPLDGIVGHNFLHEYKVRFDYPNERLILFPP